MPTDEPEIEIDSPISLRLSGPNGRLSRYDQSDKEPASSGDSVVHSPRRRPRRRLTRKEKGKKKLSDSGTDRRESDRRESDSEDSGSTELQSRSPRRPRRPRHRLMNDYADLPARGTRLCGSDTTSTWRIIMRT